ncbi:MAG: GC-type dockerin domain-anchored protein [Phycisphaerales bacterium JB060]
MLVVTDGAFGSPMVYHLDAGTARVLSAVDLVGAGTTGRTPMAALAFDGAGHLLGFTPTTDNEFYRIDRGTGQASRGGRLGVSAREGGMAVFADGTIWAASTGSPGRLFTIDPSTGRATLGPTMTPTTDISGLGVRADGLLVGLDLRSVDGPPSLRAIDTVTGETAVIAALLPRIELANVGGLEIIEVGGVEMGYFIVAGSAAGSEAQLWRFDPYTGAQTPVGIISGVEAVTGLAGLACEPCPADLDGDCEATIFDFLLLGNWFDVGDLRADLTGDGVLDVFDYLFFLNIFQAGC